MHALITLDQAAALQAPHREPGSLVGHADTLGKLILRHTHFELIGRIRNLKEREVSVKVGGSASARPRLILGPCHKSQDLLTGRGRPRCEDRPTEGLPFGMGGVESLKIIEGIGLALYWLPEKMLSVTLALRGERQGWWWHAQFTGKPIEGLGSWSLSVPDAGRPLPARANLANRGRNPAYMRSLAERRRSKDFNSPEGRGIPGPR